MLCPVCGHAEPGAADSCPSCGRSFSSAPAGVAVRRSGFDPAALRIIVYGLLGFAVARYFAGQYAAYLDAEHARLESALLSQAIEHRKAVQEAIGESDD